MNLCNTFPDQKNTSRQEDKVTDRKSIFPDREKRFGQFDNPGDGYQEQNPEYHCQ